MDVKGTAALCAALLAAGLVGCTRTVKDVSQPTIPKKEENTKFDLPPHHFIYRGMQKDRVASLVGKPRRTGTEAGRKVWHYGWGAVLFEDGKVVYKYPPSKGVENRGNQEGTSGTKEKPELPKKQP
mgnify:CR=1 FL=1